MRSIACCRWFTQSCGSIAARQLRGGAAGHTLQPTALVHEAYLRLVEQRNVDWHDRAHFYGVAAQVMRRILVDHARRHAARKRGDGAHRVPLEEVVQVSQHPTTSVLALDQALTRLEEIDPGLAQIVELRAFGGMTIDEAAHVLKVSPSTAKREWRTAKAWLTRELGSFPKSTSRTPITWSQRGARRRCADEWPARRY